MRLAGWRSFRCCSVGSVASFWPSSNVARCDAMCNTFIKKYVWFGRHLGGQKVSTGVLCNVLRVVNCVENVGFLGLVDTYTPIFVSVGRQVDT